MQMRFRLTSFGIARGEELGYRHETFKQFLQLAGVKPEDAEEDACRMEHVAGEKTVESICQFINSGVPSERVLHHSDLRFRYEPGTYEAGMGIYQMERLCPRKLAQEYYWYTEWITLEIRPGKKHLQADPERGRPDGKALVYGPGRRMDQGGGNGPHRMHTRAGL